MVAEEEGNYLIRRQVGLAVAVEALLAQAEPLVLLTEAVVVVAQQEVREVLAAQAAPALLS